jgi:hypothetical protein
MYKYSTIFTLTMGGGKQAKHTQSFKTEKDFEEWRNFQLMNGWKIIDEFDFKADLRNYIIEREGQEYFDKNYGND